MRRAQSSLEAVLAALLLSLLLSAATLVSLGSWQRAELAVAGIAAERAAQRGGDPQAAAAAAVPRLLAARARATVAR